MQVLNNARSTVGAKRKTPEDLGGAWPLAWAITQSAKEDIVTTQAPPKYSGVHLSAAGCQTDGTNCKGIKNRVNKKSPLLQGAKFQQGDTHGPDPILTTIF